MRILLIIESLRDGGKQRQVEELVRMLAEKDEYRILVLILKNEIHFERILGMHNVEVYYLKRRFKHDVSVFYSFYRKAREFTPDLIHSWGGLPCLVALPYLLCHRVPLVNEMVQNSRLPVFSRQWFRAKISFPFSSVIIGNSRIGMEVYKVPPRKARLIRNGMNTDRIRHLITQDKDQVRRQFKIKNNPKIIGMVATMDWRKNFSMFIRAGLALLEQRRDVLFFVVGEGENRPELEALVPFNLKSYFIFTGRITNVEEVVNLFDVAVLASFGEGTSNSLLEYMVLKKPVVATDVFGVNEVIEENVSGYLVPPDDHLAMMKRIEELIDHPESAQKMGEKGCEYVFRECSIEKMVADHESIYREVLKK